MLGCMSDRQEGKAKDKWKERETGRIAGQSFQREYCSLFLLLCLPTARERVLVNCEYEDLFICGFIVMLSVCGTVICSLLFEGTIYRGYCKRGELNCNTKISSSQQQSSIIPVAMNWSLIFINQTLIFKVDAGREKQTQLTIWVLGISPVMHQLKWITSCPPNLMAPTFQLSSFICALETIKATKHRSISQKTITDVLRLKGLFT